MIIISGPESSGPEHAPDPWSRNHFPLRSLGRDSAPRFKRTRGQTRSMEIHSSNPAGIASIVSLSLSFSLSFYLSLSLVPLPLSVLCLPINRCVNAGVGVSARVRECVGACKTLCTCIYHISYSGEDSSPTVCKQHIGISATARARAGVRLGVSLLGSPVMWPLLHSPDCMWCRRRSATPRLPANQGLYLRKSSACTDDVLAICTHRHRPSLLPIEVIR